MIGYGLFMGWETGVWATVLFFFVLPMLIAAASTHGGAHAEDLHAERVALIVQHDRGRSRFCGPAPSALRARMLTPIAARHDAETITGDVAADADTL